VAIERDSVDFFETSPIIVSRSRESGRILANGWIRYRIARLGGAKKIKIRVREFETDKEAYEDALVISHNLNASRGNVVGYSISNTVRYLRDAGISESRVYNLPAVLRNQELVEKVRKEEISLRETIGLAYKRTPDYDRHSVGGEAVSGDISAKEARIEVAKPGKAKVEEIRGKKAKIEEIPGMVRAEMERVFRKLENMALIGEEDELKLLRRAYEALKGEPSIRDERAVLKIASAMYKLLRPDAKASGGPDKEVLEVSMDIAVELRNRIREKLHEMIPSEFPGKPLEWRFKP